MFAKRVVGKRGRIRESIDKKLESAAHTSQTSGRETQMGQPDLVACASPPKSAGTRFREAVRGGRNDNSPISEFSGGSHLT